MPISNISKEADLTLRGTQVLYTSPETGKVYPGFIVAVIPSDETFFCRFIVDGELFPRNSSYIVRIPNLLFKDTFPQKQIDQWLEELGYRRPVGNEIHLRSFSPITYYIEATRAQKARIAFTREVHRDLENLVRQKFPDLDGLPSYNIPTVLRPDRDEILVRAEREAKTLWFYDNWPEHDSETGLNTSKVYLYRPWAGNTLIQQYLLLKNGLDGQYEQFSAALNGVWGLRFFPDKGKLILSGLGVFPYRSTRLEFPVPPDGWSFYYLWWDPLPEGAEIKLTLFVNERSYCIPSDGIPWSFPRLEQNRLLGELF